MAVRQCTECDTLFVEGFCIESGMVYYCTEECLHKHYTAEEFEEMYDDGDGDSYWTCWHESEIDERDAEILFDRLKSGAIENVLDVIEMHDDEDQTFAYKYLYSELIELNKSDEEKAVFYKSLFEKALKQNNENGGLAE